MSRHGSPSQRGETTTSTETAEDVPSRISITETTLPPSGISEVQSPLVSECSEWVKKFKSGIIKKHEASFEIHSVLFASGGKSETIKTAIKSYLAILDQHEEKLGRASERGLPRPSNQQSRSPSRSSSRSSDRPRSRTPSSDSCSLPKKKKKVAESDLPWVIRNQLLGDELRPELRATLKSLQAWSANPKQVRASIVNTPRCPAFPDFEWLNLVQGKPINLDNVFSGFYSTSTEDQRTETLGELVELKFGKKDASKPVSTHGDWTIAFDLTKEAYLFAFAHRAEELKSYQRYILQQFATKRESEHLRVIALDKAIRKRISERRDLLLSDFDQFRDLQTMHLDHYGAAEPARATGPIPSGDKPPVKKHNEPCRNWNKGVCGRGKSCYYLHVCERCLKKGHTSDKCPRKSTSGST